MKYSNLYQRQMLLPGFKQEQQQKLLDARVLVIGAGGLGCPALIYLAAAGTGHIGIIDYDKVDISNLHRQILYAANDTGQPKAVLAAKKLKQAYPNLHFEVHNCRIDTSNALSIISDYDIIVDGSDNFSTRYLLNDACVLLNKPLVYGAIYRYEGQLAVFNFADKNGLKTNYRDVFPEPPISNEVPDCSEAGVIGVLPGMIGTMQAAETIKLITGVGKVLLNKILTYNMLTTSFYEMEITSDKNTQKKIPENEMLFKNKNYELVGSNNEIKELDPAELRQMMNAEHDSLLLIDVREINETPKLQGYSYKSIPMSELENRLLELKDESKLLIFCQSGKRSITAAQMIKDELGKDEVYSLKGGLVGLLNV